MEDKEYSALNDRQLSEAICKKLDRVILYYEMSEDRRATEKEALRKYQKIPFSKYDTFGTVTARVVYTPNDGRRWVLENIIVSTTATNTFTILEGDTVIFRFYLAGSTTIVINLTRGYFAQDPRRSIQVTTTAGTSDVSLTGYEQVL